MEFKMGKGGLIATSDFLEFLDHVSEDDREATAALIEEIGKIESWEDLLDLQMKVMAAVVRGHISPAVSETLRGWGEQLVVTMTRKEGPSASEGGLMVLAQALQDASEKAARIEPVFHEQKQIPEVIDLDPLPDVIGKADASKQPVCISVVSEAFDEDF